MSSKKVIKKFEKIYKETYDNTLKYIISRCYNINEVDDIIQETYLEIYKVIEEKRKIENYQAYIITTAKNKMIKYFNKNKRMNTVSIFQESDDKDFIIDIDAGIDIESEFITKENIDEIWKYLSSVDTQKSKIFYLYFIEDMTIKQISEDLEIPESTIKSNIYRMLKNIKNNCSGGEKVEK